MRLTCQAGIYRLVSERRRPAPYYLTTRDPESYVQETAVTPEDFAVATADLCGCRLIVETHTPHLWGARLEGDPRTVEAFIGRLNRANIRNSPCLEWVITGMFAATCPAVLIAWIDPSLSKAAQIWLIFWLLALFTGAFSWDRRLSWPCRWLTLRVNARQSARLA